MSDLRLEVALLRGLAVNPRAPLSVLRRLAAYSRHELSLSTALLDREQLPAPVVRTLVGHPDPQVRCRLAAHPSTPDEIRYLLADDPESIVRAEVAAWPGSWVNRPSPRPVTAKPLPVGLYRKLAADEVPAVRAAVGKNAHVPEDVRAVLVGDTNQEVRRCTALCVLPPAALRQLIGDADRVVRQTALMTAAVHTPRVTIPEDLAELFHDDPAYYRQTAVELVELTPSLLERLWAQPDLGEALARNPGLSGEQMRPFLENAELLPAFAGNPGLPARLLEELVATDDPEVHRELLRRVDLPDRLRRQLTAAKEDYEPLPLADSLLPENAGLEERLSYLGHPNPAFRRTLAFSPDLPTAAVEQLAMDPDFLTRLLVCERHTDVPPTSLVEVVEHWRGHTREDLLRHPRLPRDVLPRFAASDSVRDRLAIASRTDLPADLALDLLSDPATSVQRAAAGNHNLSHEVLRQLLAGPDPYLREGAASNPALSVEEMERLLASVQPSWWGSSTR